jgi:hypothetical protein
LQRTKLRFVAFNLLAAAPHPVLFFRSRPVRLNPLCSTIVTVEI